MLEMSSEAKLIDFILLGQLILVNNVTHRLTFIPIINLDSLGFIWFYFNLYKYVCIFY